MKEAFVETGHDSSKVMLLGVNIKDSPITTTNLVSKQLPPDHVDIKNSPSTSTNSLHQNNYHLIIIENLMSSITPMPML
jgi:hypothetical protein